MGEEALIYIPRLKLGYSRRSRCSLRSCLNPVRNDSTSDDRFGERTKDSVLEDLSQNIFHLSIGVICLNMSPNYAMDIYEIICITARRMAIDSRYGIHA